MNRPSERSAVASLVAAADTRPSDRHYLNAKQAAQILGVSSRHLLRLAARREVASVRLSSRCTRFTLADLTRFAERHRVGELRERS